jgi:hypothetical protein
MFIENFKQETQSSYWKKIYSSFRVHSVFHGGKKGSRVHKNKIYNQIRLVTIQGFTCLEVRTQKPEITFLCEISDYTKLRTHIWSVHKIRNIYYIQTEIKKNNKKITLYFHQLIKTGWKIIDHINRIGLDNRKINLRETTKKENALNCKLKKNNTSGYNGICYDKFSKRYKFQWNEDKKRKSKYFKIKEEAIEYKLKHNKITENRNGYDI